MWSLFHTLHVLFAPQGVCCTQIENTVHNLIGLIVPGKCFTIQFDTASSSVSQYSTSTFHPPGHMKPSGGSTLFCARDRICMCQPNHQYHFKQSCYLSHVNSKLSYLRARDEQKILRPGRIKEIHFLLPYVICSNLIIQK